MKKEIRLIVIVGLVIIVLILLLSVFSNASKKSSEEGVLATILDLFNLKWLAELTTLNGEYGNCLNDDDCSGNQFCNLDTEKCETLTTPSDDSSGNDEGAMADAGAGSSNTKGPGLVKGDADVCSENWGMSWSDSYCETDEATGKDKAVYFEDVMVSDGVDEEGNEIPGVVGCTYEDVCDGDYEMCEVNTVTNLAECVTTCGPCTGQDTIASQLGIADKKYSQTCTDQITMIEDEFDCSPKYNCVNNQVVKEYYDDKQKKMVTEVVKKCGECEYCGADVEARCDYIADGGEYPEEDDDGWVEDAGYYKCQPVEEGTTCKGETGTPTCTGSNCKSGCGLDPASSGYACYSEATLKDKDNNIIYNPKTLKGSERPLLPTVSSDSGVMKFNYDPKYNEDLQCVEVSVPSVRNSQKPEGCEDSSGTSSGNPSQSSCPNGVCPLNSNPSSEDSCSADNPMMKAINNKFEEAKHEEIRRQMSQIEDDLAQRYTQNPDRNNQRDKLLTGTSGDKIVEGILALEHLSYISEVYGDKIPTNLENLDFVEEDLDYYFEKNQGEQNPQYTQYLVNRANQGPEEARKALKELYNDYQFAQHYGGDTRKACNMLSNEIKRNLYQMVVTHEYGIQEADQFLKIWYPESQGLSEEDWYRLAGTDNWLSRRDFELRRSDLIHDFNEKYCGAPSYDSLKQQIDENLNYKKDLIDAYNAAIKLVDNQGCEAIQKLCDGINTPEGENDEEKMEMLQGTISNSCCESSEDLLNKAKAACLDSDFQLLANYGDNSKLPDDVYHKIGSPYDNNVRPTFKYFGPPEVDGDTLYNDGGRVQVPSFKTYPYSFLTSGQKSWYENSLSTSHPFQPANNLLIAAGGIGIGSGIAAGNYLRTGIALAGWHIGTEVAGIALEKTNPISVDLGVDFVTAAGFAVSGAFAKIPRDSKFGLVTDESTGRLKLETGKNLDPKKVVREIPREEMEKLVECAQAKSAEPAPGCFLAGTPILMADGSYKNIQDVLIGDKVVGYDIFNNKPVDVDVTTTFVRPATSYRIIEYEVVE